MIAICLLLSATVVPAIQPIKNRLPAVFLCGGKLRNRDTPFCRRGSALRWWCRCDGCGRAAWRRRGRHSARRS